MTKVKIMVSSFLIALVFVISFWGPTRDQETHNIIGCTIYDMKGRVLWRLNFERCIFYEDGSVVAANSKKIIFYNKSLETVWEQPISSHHQLNRDGDEILVLSEANERYQGKVVRFDILYIFHRSGALLKSFELSKNAATWDRAGEALWVMESDAEENKAQYEFSHLNSFYKIHKNMSAKQLSAFQEGNYIVNDNCSGRFYIFDSSLQNILWFGDHPRTSDSRHNSHDAQVLPNGNILFYANWVDQKKESAIMEYDPRNKKLLRISPEESAKPFFMDVRGGVQLLKSGHYLLNSSNDGLKAHEFEPKKWEEVWKMESFENEDGKEFFQQIKRDNLTQFLKKNKGL